MIKINLASRKTATALQSQGSGTGLTLQRLQNFKVEDAAALAGAIPKFREFLILGVAIFAAQWFYDDYEKTQLAEFDQKVAQAQEAKQVQQKKLDETKKFDVERKRLEADELVLKTKLEVVTQLLEGRTQVPRVMIAVSSAIPNNVWVNSVQFDQKGGSINGAAIDFNLVGDFQRNLKASVFFKEVTLQGTNNAREDNLEVAQFQLTLQRR
jgi:Tfp pilus assembly protein PilN